MEEKQLKRKANERTHFSSDLDENKEKINVDKNGNDKQKLYKKNKSLSFREKEAVYTYDSNEVIFFKIVNSKEEFYDFILNENYTNSFNPNYTNQIFPEEKITGYKNLKIFISLTPRLLYPHVKIKYDSVSSIKDDIELLLKNHYEQIYETNDENFLAKLENDLTPTTPIGEIIYKFDNYEIKYYDILKERALDDNFNYQCLLTYFIDGASFIPIENNFWFYFTLHEKIDSQYRIIGYSSIVKFHMDIFKYRGMISQFFILPIFQRNGFGNILLTKIFEFFNNDENCIEITTEDPGNEFILLRDVVLFTIILNKRKFDKYINLLPITVDNYDNFEIDSNEYKRISHELKIHKTLINRCFYIFKYINIGNNSILYEKFKKDIFQMIYKINKADFEIEMIKLKFSKRMPYIYFHDEDDFQIDLTELNCLNNSETNKAEKLEIFYSDIESDLKQIYAKCLKLINIYIKKC